MKYWIQGQQVPLSIEEIANRPELLIPTANCAPVGTSEWRPLIEVVPQLFDQSSHLVTAPQQAAAVAIPAIPEFERETGWSAFFYTLAVINAVGGVVIAVSINMATGIVVGFASVISCLFFAFASQLGADIRWLIAQQLKKQK